jgi:hypothetical protein
MIKRDRNEPAIVQLLRQLGADYIPLEPFDLLVWHRARLFMLDVKTPEGRATQRQRELIARGWPLQFVRTPDETLRALGLQRGT